MVLNNTKVLPARLYGKRATGGRVEILLLTQIKGGIFECLMRPARLKEGEKIFFDGGTFNAVVLAKNQVRFNTEDSEKIYRMGITPLPPYIKRTVEPQDVINYQTIYAEKEGSVAAPTAGLHFTKELLLAIKKKGINIVYITVHIGYATFKPIKCEDLCQHKISEEYFEIPQEALAALKKTRKQAGRIVAVGTSVVRALETVSLEDANTSISGKTELFIYPGYKFKNVDCLVTNFHLPRTTPFILVCAFAGKELIQNSYKQAIDNFYRFLSFGDAMFII